MAERLNRRHQEMVREKIRASQLINRLENHVFGDLDLSNTQVTAALGLLKKCVPDLKATEHSNPDGSGLFDKVQVIGRKPEDTEPGSS